MAKKTQTQEVAPVVAATEEQLAVNETVVATVEHKVTKADLARAIYAEETGKGTTRKDVIARMIVEAGLTKAGAGTYYQNFRNKAGLVIHKPKAEAAPVETAPAEEVAA